MKRYEEGFEIQSGKFDGEGGEGEGGEVPCLCTCVYTCVRVIKYVRIRGSALIVCLCARLFVLRLNKFRCHCSLVTVHKHASTHGLRQHTQMLCSMTF